MILSESEKMDFIKKAAFIADNSTCLYKIGCVGVTKLSKTGLKMDNKHTKDYRDSNIKILRDFIYIKTWNKTLPGEKFCQELDEAGEKICIRKVENLKGRDFQKVCSIHAESNLISKCAKYGISTDGMVIFVTNMPCYVCSKLLIVAGISELYYISSHTDLMGVEILEKNGIKCRQIKF